MWEVGLGFGTGGGGGGPTPTDYPAPADVRYGVAYNFGALTGTLILPVYGTSADEIEEHTAANIIQKLLIAGGLGTQPISTSTSWPVFINSQPDSPDSVITVYDTTGVLGGRLNPNGVFEEQFGVMVQVRGAGPTLGGKKARMIARYFDKSVSETIVTLTSGSTSYQYMVHSVARQSPVNRLGAAEEGSSRNLWTVNALVTISLLNP